MRRRALLAGLLTPVAATAQEDLLAARMRRLAAVPARLSRFTEERALPELDLPIPYTGTLSWQAPDRLEKHTLSPIEERLTVTGGRLVWERPDRGQRREFTLADQPEMGALVEAIRGTLAGDLALLRRHYDVAYQDAPGDGWTLRLLPLSARLRGAVQRITVTGQGAEVAAVETQEGGGTSRMRILLNP